MTMTTRGALAGLGLAFTAACGGSSSDPGTTMTYDGTWVACRNDGASPGDLPDHREAFRITGGTVVVTDLEYATTDLSCDGDATASQAMTAAVTYGARTSVPFGVGTVQATQVDLTLPLPETFYTLIYRDTAARPEVLYLGDDTGALDGSSPALRPTTLQVLRRALQTDPVPADLGGTWSSCTAGGGSVLVIDTGAGTLRATKYAGDCGVPANATEDLTFGYTLGTAVYATLGDLTVTAFAPTMTRAGGGTVHQTFWVDKRSTPWALHGGDDGLHGMDGSTPSLRPRVLNPVALLKQ